jgi:hypothetical protein
MSTKFLELADGVIIEIGGAQDVREEMHTSTAELVDTTMNMVTQKLRKILTPIANSFHSLYDAVDVPVEIESAEVELGVSFSAEGNVFVAKSKAEGTMKVTVTFKPSARPQAPPAPVVLPGAPAAPAQP